MPVIDQHSKKVFCVGFNKTGTNSLHQFFLHQGLNSTHNDSWPNRSWVQGAGKYFTGFDCFTDGEAANVRRLDLWFPSALFILNQRNERDWMRSRVKHVLRHNDDLTPSEVLHSTDYGWMAKGFFCDPFESMKMWVSKKRVYEKMVRYYFEGTDKLLEIDVTREPDWTKRLGAFLEAHGMEVKADEGLTFHRNKRDADEIEDLERLSECYELIDTVLAQNPAQ